MVESLTIGAAVAGFVAGGAFRALSAPLLDVEHFIDSELQNKANGQAVLAQHERRALADSLKRITVRSVIGFGIFGALAAVAVTKTQHWWAMYKFGKSERMNRLERALEQAKKEEVVSEMTMTEIEEARRELRGFFRRRWDGLVEHVTSYELPEWIREDKSVTETMKHREEMDMIYREFERMKTKERAREAPNTVGAGEQQQHDSATQKKRE